MKLFEMSNSFTQKTRSIWIFYTGIALLLKSWIVLCICIWIWKTCSILEFCPTCSWGQFSATSPRILSSAFPGRIIWVVGGALKSLIFSLPRLNLLFRFFVHVYSTTCFSFCFYFLFIVLETCWALFVHHLGELVAMRSFDLCIWSPWWACDLP